MSIGIKLRAVTATLLAVFLLLLYGAASNLWRHTRMRSIPVEVIRSSLLIDAPQGNDGTLLPLEYLLRLDLVAAGEPPRSIHWEDEPANATYPEEAFDELARWAPGTRHTIFQVRGDGNAIRLPGGANFPEKSAGILYGVLAFFAGTLALAFTAMLSDADSQLNRLGLGRFAGPWLIFFLCGIGALYGAATLTIEQTARATSWLPVTATVSKAPGNYTADTLPPNSVLTAAARRKLEEADHHVLRFDWNGVTIHAGLGTLDGKYDPLLGACVAAPSCQFKIDPMNRWNFKQNTAWNSEFFLPFGLLLLLGLIFTSAGLALRRRASQGG